jgi:DNA repair protein RadC
MSTHSGAHPHVDGRLHFIQLEALMSQAVSQAVLAAEAVHLPVSVIHSLTTAAAAAAKLLSCMPSSSNEDEDAIIQRAIALIERRCFKRGPILNSPQVVREFLQLKLAAEPNEVFAVLFLDAQNSVLAYEPMFFGTTTQTSVYPRVVLQRALELNASNVILAHNHPSGVTEPSRADELLTQTLKSTLHLADIKVLDHFIVGAGQPFSFAEKGLL